VETTDSDLTQGDTNMATQRIASGQTPQGTTAWQTYPAGTPPANSTGVFVDVNTTAGKFQTAPAYITSIGGDSHHWATTGASSVYPVPPDLLPTATRFRVYVRWIDGANLTPAIANSHKWHINWIGMEL
jgi:hypothetical protein